MATDMVDDQEMREAQRDYLDFLDDDVSVGSRFCAHAVIIKAVKHFFFFFFKGTLLVVKFNSGCDALNSYHIDKI